jgi:hypothetical protein
MYYPETRSRWSTVGHVTVTHRRVERVLGFFTCGFQICA